MILNEWVRRINGLGWIYNDLRSIIIRAIRGSRTAEVGGASPWSRQGGGPGGVLGAGGPWRGRGTAGASDGGPPARTTAGIK